MILIFYYFSRGSGPQLVIHCSSLTIPYAGVENKVSWRLDSNVILEVMLCV